MQRQDANRRHQQTAEGRLDHRDRQREYRRRHGRELRVTDQRSAIARISPNLADANDEQRPEGLVPRFEVVTCMRCGRSGVLIDPFRG